MLLKITNLKASAKHSQIKKLELNPEVIEESKEEGVRWQEYCRL